MKKYHFILEFIKSGPFMLLIILALVVLLGLAISNHHKHIVQMRQNVLYVSPKPKN
jgi:hypothetical protein